MKASNSGRQERRLEFDSLSGARCLSINTTIYQSALLCITVQKFGIGVKYLAIRVCKL
jgi:hypothetical protein